MSISGSGSWDGEVDDTEVEPTDSISGDTSPSMSLWKQDRVPKLNTLSGSQFTNQSSFDIPNAVIGSGWDNSLTASEFFEGVNVSMLPISPDGKPLSGTAEIYIGDNVWAAKQTTSSFTLASDPPPGVYLGQSVSVSSYKFIFSPSTAGLSIVKEDISTVESYGSIQYGSIEGTVTDYNDDPLENAVVKGEGAGDVTGAEGNYSILAPGGTSVTLAALDGTYEFSLNPVAGSTLTQDIQASRIKVRVRDANFDPISNAPVNIAGEGYRTNENGKVVINNAVLAKYGILVMEKFTHEVDVTSSGTEYTVTLGPSSSDFVSSDEELSGFDLKVIDGATGKPAEDLRVVDLIGESAGYTNRNGRSKILSVPKGGGSIAAVVGSGDPRFSSITVTAQATQDMVEEEVVVPRKIQAGTR